MLLKRKICKNCKYWRKIDKSAYEMYFGKKAPKFACGNCYKQHYVWGGMNELPIDGTIYDVLKGHKYVWNNFYTGEKFGCIHFTRILLRR